MLVRNLSKSIKLLLFKQRWRKNNYHNYTTVKNIFPIEKVSVGVKTYGALNVKTYGNPKEKLIIGSFCSIAGDVKFLLGGEHYYKGLSTYPFKKYICGLREITLTKGPIVIQDDVWIGEGSLILSGVTIGQGAIVAAGSIVVKDIPPYAIYAGNKVIKYRFSEDIINQLLNFNFSNLNDEIIKNNIEFLYSELDIHMLNNFHQKSI
ncbi:CatB-related O-acetyltransferase [Schinkia azotoformans]|uniref:CatB-related O-acetyltransferase n=1 Tax=Schinkia azotoformans TaxID=1454 RepID=UPI002DB655E5|nr:CatB-related O-acetyltransferase [Schinkia azotoformans]MEC1719109.1 CatB-related O-acetyltransferase [Schinkia azotoformans]MED4413843.1 CatB-related O-acetyltransferase [Schinkia azotoformans]